MHFISIMLRLPRGLYRAFRNVIDPFVALVLLGVTCVLAQMFYNRVETQLLGGALIALAFVWLVWLFYATWRWRCYVRLWKLLCRCRLDTLEQLVGGAGFVVTGRFNDGRQQFTYWAAGASLTDVGMQYVMKDTLYVKYANERELAFPEVRWLLEELQDKRILARDYDHVT